VLTLHGPLGSGVEGFLLAPLEVLETLFHRVLSHNENARYSSAAPVPKERDVGGTRRYVDAVGELQRVCVFCGSSDGTRPGVQALAVELGAHLAAEGIGLVYGGASIGIMGLLADAVLSAGGEAIGVIPGGLFRREVPHPELTELRVVDGMHERKATMYALADGFIALPGGYGTLDELFEATTWNQLHLHSPRKPITLLDDDGFWDPLMALLDTMLDAGFVKPGGHRLMQRASTPADALDRLRTFEFDDFRSPSQA
jgi:uncharacterized protein (TIGR00730 family)